MAHHSCILSGCPIESGDRIVAVLAVPRLRESSMKQEFGPTGPLHRSSAASYAIRGAYDSFGNFAPDEGQEAVALLKAATGIEDWDSLIASLHSEGFPYLEPMPLPPAERVRRKTFLPSAFAFVHEEMMDAVAVVPSVDEAWSNLEARAAADPDVRTYRVMGAASDHFLFGSHQPVSSALAYDGIGAELLEEPFSDRLVAFATGGTDEEGLRRNLGCLADLSAFQFALYVTGVVLHPSTLGARIPEARATVALMTAERMARSRIERDVENDEPTEAISRMVAVASTLVAERADADRRMEEYLASLDRPSRGG